MKKLYFVRHGESLGNVQRFFTGTFDAPLTDLGRKQAAAAGLGGQNLAIDCIVTSPLSRAKQTAEIIAGFAGVSNDKIISSDLFVERSYGSLQERPYEAADGLDFEKIPGIETTEQLTARAEKAVEFLQSLDANCILVASHGTFGRVLRCALLKEDQASVEVPIEQELPNAQIIRWI